MNPPEIRTKVRPEPNGTFAVVAVAAGHKPAVVAGFGSRQHAARNSFIAVGDLRARIDLQKRREYSLAGEALLAAQQEK